MATYRERSGAMGRLLNAPGEPVHDFVRDLGEETRREAPFVASERLRIRTGAYNPRGWAGPVMRAGSTGPVATVSNVDEKALGLELGTPPHLIRPIAPGGYVVTPGVRGRRPAPPRGWLRFTIGGRVVFAREVRHPGTQPYGVLQEALRRVVRRSA